jgi:hypothetical protein
MVTTADELGKGAITALVADVMAVMVDVEICAVLPVPY